MRRSLSLGLLLGLLTIMPMQQAHAVRILGQGTDTCDIWLRARTGPERNEYREWFLGYLSASAYLKSQDILQGMSYDNVLARVLRACQADPSKRLMTCWTGSFGSGSRLKPARTHSPPCRSPQSRSGWSGSGCSGSG